MPAPTVFVTGVTGYIGGDALHVVYKLHPDWRYRLLVRSAERGAPVLEHFPGSELILGSLDDLALLKKEAAAADIIMQFATSDHPPSMQAIADGLASRDPSKPAYFIHTSGSANITYEEVRAGTFGELSNKTWDDINDLEAIKTLPDDATHQLTDKIVMEAGAPTLPHVRRAIVCPPAIVGTGRGPINNRSLNLPLLIEIIRQRKRGFQIGRGLSRMSVIHIHNLSNVYLALAEDAASGGNRPEVWASGGFFFVENGECEWGAVSQRVTRRLHDKRPDLMPSIEVDKIWPQEVEHLFPLAGLAWGVNSRCRASRLRKVLGWKALRDDFEAQYDAAVDFELEEAKQSRLQDWADGHFPMFSDITSM